MDARELLGDDGPLSRVLHSYESRPEQLRMADVVQAALDEGSGLLVEAGTGTGKSLAYLVPAALSSLRVVISTATKALGEQIMEKDIHTLRHLGLRPDVTLVKGLSNYLCLRRFEEHRQGVASGLVAPEPGLDRVIDWAEQTAVGDRSELAAVADEAAVWREVVSSSETRIGPKCRFYDQCFVTKMRRSAEAAQIIVTNHHMFCADMALRGPSGAQALPDYDAVIFDEAHALEDVATEFFGVRLTRARIETLLRDADRALRSAGFFVDRSRESSLQRTLGSMAAGALRIFSSLPKCGAGGGTRTLLTRDAVAGDFGEGAAQLLQALTELSAHVRDFVGMNDTLLSVSRRTATLTESVRIVMDPDSATHVTFCEPDARGGGAVGASPVEIGPILTSKLWSRRGAVIMTSATLSGGGGEGAGDFGFIRQRLGVPASCAELSLPSPFDFASQAGLYIPAMMPEPRENSFLDAAVDEVEKLVHITRGGAFVLCTSVRVMRALYEASRYSWSYPTWIQGEAPKRALLERFRAAGDAVLFATASFWEGVDVPGRALRLVIIDKLPFDAPNDPVTAARIARLTAAGQSAFDDYQVPTAALALKQGFGRLIRTRRDTGIVAILDRRIVTKRYGRTLLGSLPPATRCATIADVQRFWNAVEAIGP